MSSLKKSWTIKGRAAKAAQDLNVKRLLNISKGLEIQRNLCYNVYRVKERKDDPMMTDEELMQLVEEELFNDPFYLEWLEERAEEAREMEALEASYRFSENY